MGVVIVELFIGAYYYTLFEIMSNSAYIEERLATAIKKTFPSIPDFWEYERYRRGNRVYSPSGMYLWMIPAVVTPYLALLLLRPPHRDIIDFTGSLVSLGITSWVFHIARKAVLTQRRFAP
jgi:hypothetical protein